MTYKRYSLFPIQHEVLYDLYKKQRDAFWVPAEVDLQTDVNDWRDKLTENDKHFLTYTLAFFAQADGIVLQNIEENFSLDIDIPEANLFYGIQSGIEAIHWEMYNLLIETFIESEKNKLKAFNAIENYPAIKAKADWMLKWMNNSQEYIYRLVAFACAEGIFFSSAFASIFYYKKRGLLPGLVKSNSFIARDEGLHRDFGCELFKILAKDVDYQKVNEIIQSSVDIECEFVEKSLNVELIGIDSTKMKQYVKFVANSLYQKLGMNKHYEVENPFDWMNMIGMVNKQNFFENKVSEYKKTQSKPIFNTDADF